ncbi:MAG: hypothetical protein NC922_03525 [Candidatus Omnitrophica bacterium]|nr:hypothetical protein [Candidatus Omnitrophota bacterium]
MKRLKILSSFCLLFVFVSCYLNKNIAGKKIYFEKFENFTLNSSLNFFLNEKIKEIFLKYPGYTLTETKENSDYVCQLQILKFERIPLYYSKENIYEISGARFEIKVKISIKNNDLNFEKELVESVSTSIHKEFKEEDILSRISEGIAKKIYFEFLNLNKK